MQIDLAADLFQETGNLLDILAIFRCFTDGPHDWVTSADRLSVAEEYLKEHVSAVAATLIELGRKGLVAAAWTSGTPTAIHSRAGRQDRGSAVHPALQTARWPAG